MGLPAFIPVKELDVTEIITNFLTIKENSIRKYIPPRAGSQLKSCLRVLVIIASGNFTKTFIRSILGVNKVTIDNAIDHLNSLGLIALQKKPRRITQLNTWKVEKIWTITPKGQGVLKSLLEGVAERKPVAYWTEPKVR
jgi:hypothetical protein